jgi:hypothetical protein
MNSNKILNLPNAATAQEPVTKAQLDAAGTLTSSDASTTNYTATGTGAIERTVQASLDDLHFYVKDFGAVAGASDSTVAIQAAMDAAIAAGGGTVYFGDKNETFTLNTATTVGGLSTCLTWNGDNVTFAGKANIEVTVAGARTIIFGMGISGTAFNTYASQTVYTLSGTYLPGGSVLALATAGETSNFSVGDYVWIRTGQLLTATDNEPDAELNKVRAIGVGTLTMEWPLVKPYAQENYPAGHSEAGNPAPFGVANVNAVTMQNTTIKDELKFINPNTVTNFAGGQIEGLWWDVEYDCATSFNSMGNYRHFDINVRRGHLEGQNASTNYFVSGAVGTSDGRITGHFDSENGGFIHLHEGCANIDVITPQIFYQGPASGANNAAVDINARGYNINVLSPTIFSPNGNFAVRVAADCIGGGVIDNVQLVGADTSGVRVIAPSGWHVGKVTKGYDVVVEDGNTVEDGERFFGAQEFFATTGTPVMGALSSNIAVMLFDAATTERATVSFRTPDNWRSAIASLYWTDTTAGTGDVVWAMIARESDAGDNFSGTAILNQSQTLSVTGGEELDIDAFNEMDIAKDLVYFSVQRTGGDGADTLAVDAGLIGLRLRRTK